MEEVSKYVSDLIGPTTVTPRVGGGTEQRSGAVIEDKTIGLNIGNKNIGNLDISAKKENITSQFGKQEIDSVTGSISKKFDSGLGIDASITKRDPNQGKKETDKRLMLTYEKKFGKKNGGLVEIGKGKDYIKDLL